MQLGIRECQRGEIDLRGECFEAHVLQAVGDSGFDFRDRSSGGVDPRGPGQLQRIFPSPKRQRGGRFHARYVLKIYFLQRVAGHNFLSRRSELERRRVVGMEDQKECSKAIAQEHGRILPVLFGLTNGDAGFGETKFTAVIGEDNEIVVSRVLLEFHFLIFVQFFLTHMLGALYV